ncbi:MAG TPA: hypothetical protein VJ417_14540, partial [Candidatus Glassbacteria bacterium]|nr:hypothetical protein [Candidatus Glassbacteria bacterium]
MIVVPVDGASNVKLEVLDFATLDTLYSRETSTPVREVAGLNYNASGEEFAWFDDAIRNLPRELARVKVVAPAARGASGGLVGPDNTLVEEPGQELTLSYSQAYPEEVERAFRELVPEECGFYQETGSVRDFPGSLT